MKEEGEGENKKEAKKAAAEKMYNKIKSGQRTSNGTQEVEGVERAEGVSRPASSQVMAGNNADRKGAADLGF